MFDNLNIKTKSLKILSPIMTLLGIIFILTGKYVKGPILSLIVMALGLFLLYMSLPLYVKAIKNEYLSDKLRLILSGAGILLGLYCIFNYQAAVKTLISLIGIVLTIGGSTLFYKIITDEKDSDKESQSRQFEDNSTS